MSEKLDLYTLPLTGTRLIEASAGTGKTWTIAGLYVRLLLEGEGVPVEQLLVVTYTRAATAELKERLRRRLAELLAAFEAGDSDDEFCRNMVAQYAAEPALAQARLTRAIAAFDEAAIHTIHGFCQRVLAEAAFEAGSDFEPELVADLEPLLQAAAADCWRRETHAAEPLWAAYLLHQGESPARWAQRVRPHLGKPYLQLPELEVSALAGPAAAWQAAQEALRHALAAEGEAALAALLEHPKLSGSKYKKDKLPGWFAELAALAAAPLPPFAAVAALDKLSASTLAAGMNKGGEVPPLALFAVVEQVAGAWQALLGALETRRVALCHRLIGEIDAELSRRKQVQGVDGFDDLLTRLAAALEGPGAPALAAAVQARYQVALIDEFQDTDPVQWAVFQRLFATGGRPLVLVGDPKQAIYRFRGADLFTYLSAGRQAEQTYVLGTNFRSVPPLIDGINALFTRQPGSFIEDIAYEPVGARGRLQLIDPDAPAAIQFQLLPAQAGDKGEKAWGKSEASQAVVSATAAEIRRLLTVAELDDGTTRRRLAPGDIAVLASTHGEAAQMERALAAWQIPAVRQTQESVFASHEAEDWHRVLVAIARPRDEAALRAALLSDCMGHGSAELDALYEDTPAWAAWQDAFAHWHALWLGRGFFVMFRAWFERVGAGGLAVGPRLLGLPDGERRLTNLLHLAELMQRASRQTAGLGELLAWYEARLVEPGSEGEAALLRLPSDAARVKIVTIHASKGLEYPVVFCPWLWNGSLLKDKETLARCHDAEGRLWLDFGSPQLDERLEAYRRETLAEKLRLLYVALTRAKSRLVIHWGLIDRAGAKGNEGLHTSALAWLLHGRGELAGLRPRLADCGSADLAADLAQLVSAAPDSFAVRLLDSDTLAQAPQPWADASACSEAQPLACARLGRTLASAWRLSSFSRLSSGREVESERPDHDAAATAPQAEAELRSVFSFPGGEVPAHVAGTCLHGVFEDWAAGLPYAERIERRLLEHGLQAHWVPVVTQLVERTLAASLDGAALRLGELPRAARRAELEFTFPVRAMRLEGLSALLARHGLPAAFVEAAQRLEVPLAAGFMKGFVDLVFQAGGRFYLLDWKSNWLGPTLADYTPPHLEAAMASHHYYLQALIYSVALERYLRCRVPDYSHERHFGGCYYLFLRGMQAGCRDSGVWFDRPSAALLAELGAWLQG